MNCLKGLLALACVSLAACSADSVAEPTSGPAAVPGAAQTATSGGSSVPSTGAASTGTDRAHSTDNAFPSERTDPNAFFCRPGAFCEDFEEQGWQSRWADAFTQRGRLESSSLSASTGKSSLRIYTDDETSSAFLLQPKGDVTANWSGSLAFAFRVDTIPGLYLGGPELLVKTDDGPITIRVALKPEGLVIEQSATDACRKDRCTTSSMIVAPSKEGQWYHVRLGFEVNAVASRPYGRLEVTVDGGDLQATDLTVPMAGGSMFLRAGVTQGDRRAAYADLDDVSLFVQ